MCGRHACGTVGALGGRRGRVSPERIEEGQEDWMAASRSTQASVDRKKRPGDGHREQRFAKFLQDTQHYVAVHRWECVTGRSPLAGDKRQAPSRASARKQAPTDVRPHGCDLRKGRWSETGRIYLITAVTEQRRLVFSDFSCARLLIRELRAADARYGSTTWAFVVMSDHFHWLVELRDPDLSRPVLWVKSRSAIAINRALGRNGRLWQKGFHDHALRGDEDLRDTARYLIANPMRAGLVASVRDYPHWDARWI